MPINGRATIFLLSFPIGLMGVVQMAFAIISFTIFHDHEEVEFFYPALAMLAFAPVSITFFRDFDVDSIGYRDALFFATATWTIMGVLGAIPIVLLTRVSITDGIFESISALTTTGATILKGLDDMPRSFLMYRQFLQWLGGLGVVIFVVAILPMLNVGGMKLLRAETPGPIKEDKLSPRIAHTTHYLWIVYIVITVLCAVCYYLAGMTPYDAIAHSLTTVSTGGFSTHDASMSYFRSDQILLVADVFMILGATSFALHFRVYKARRPGLYWQDEEMRVFLILIIVLSAITAVTLLETGTYTSTVSAFGDATFQVISFITSTGYGANQFVDWPAMLLFLLVFAGYLGGCSGSTAGGNKIIRNILSVKSINLEIQRLIHSKGVITIKYHGRPVDHRTLNAVSSFMFVAATSTMVLTLVMMSSGLDFWSSLTAVAACLNVLGPAFGELANNFQPVSDFGTGVLSFAMILGRLEYFTVLALLEPAFWTR